jgi:hypothetical protein
MVELSLEGANTRAFVPRNKASTFVPKNACMSAPSTASLRPAPAHALLSLLDPRPLLVRREPGSLIAPGARHQGCTRLWDRPYRKVRTYPPQERVRCRVFLAPAGSSLLLQPRGVLRPPTHACYCSKRWGIDTVPHSLHQNDGWWPWTRRLLRLPPQPHPCSPRPAPTPTPAPAPAPAIQ